MMLGRASSIRGSIGDVAMMGRMLVDRVESAEMASQINVFERRT